MVDIDQISKDDKTDIIRLLNEVFKIEYCFIVHYPRLADAARNKTSRQLVLDLGKKSISHSSMVAEIIGYFGGNAKWQFDPLPDGYDTVRMYEQQLEQKQALGIYSQIVNKARHLGFITELSGIAEEQKKKGG